MGYSVNYYLDKAISKKNLSVLMDSNDKDIVKSTEEKINNEVLQLFLYLRFSGKTLKVYVERKCTQKQWDANKQRVNSRYYKNGALEFNQYLERVHLEISKMYETNLKENRATTKDHLKAIVLAANNKSTSGLGMPSFLEAYDEFIEISSTTKQKSTISSYRNVLKHLLAFSKKTKTPLLFETINIKFEDKLRGYLFNVCGHSNNTVAKTFKILKTFMTYSFDRDYTTNLAYNKFNSIETAKEIYALSLDEVFLLLNYDFGENIHFANTRDLFCFSCFTGLRISDVSRLSRDSIKNGVLHIFTQKTKDDIKIPLNKYAQEILERHLELATPLPYVPTDKLNKSLKEIGKLLNIDEPVRKVLIKGGEREITHVPKYEIMTFHIARKTFITNSLILGMQERVVREFSGHKEEKSFAKYVKFADSYKEQQMKDIWSKENIESKR